MPARGGTVDQSVEDAICRLSTLEGFEKIRFIILFGSAARGQDIETSDIDLCIYFDGDADASSSFRFRALSEIPADIYDIHLFRQLPLFTRMEVLRGRVIFCPDERFLYEIAQETIRDFDAFKHRLYDYIGQKAMV
jgi:hypothetical protein